MLAVSNPCSPSPHRRCLLGCPQLSVRASHWIVTAAGAVAMDLLPHSPPLTPILHLLPHISPERLSIEQSLARILVVVTPIQAQDLRALYHP